MSRIKISVPALICVAFAAAFYDAAFVLAAIAAAAVHESGHMVVLLHGGCDIEEIYISLCGARIEYLCRKQKSYAFDALAAVAGPLLNAAAAFATVWLAPSRVLFAAYFIGFNVIFAAFNLLPAAPLDGGRVLTALTAQRINPEKAERIGMISTAVCGTALAAGGAAVWLVLDGSWSLLAVSVIILKNLPIKKLYRNPFKSYYK